MGLDGYVTAHIEFMMDPIMIQNAAICMPRRGVG